MERSEKKRPSGEIPASGPRFTSAILSHASDIASHNWTNWKVACTAVTIEGLFVLETYLIGRGLRERENDLRRQILAALVGLVALSSPALAQLDFERPPIDYLRAAHDDPVERLRQKLDSAAAPPAHDAERGYLPALLGELGISEKSQVLVFSKTSFQRSKIGPKRPRALYFNDDTYVGWVQNGDVLEVASVAPRLGTIFYTLDQKPAEKLDLVRRNEECLQCHASPATSGIPGLMVRSVFPAGSGNPILSAGGFQTTWQSPLEERWGGWYVTGTHGRQRHMGNAVMRGTTDPAKLDRESGANLADLSSRFDPTPYLTGHSDIVALLVLEHQAPAHNQITLAGYQALLARNEQEVLNKMSGKPAGEPIESIERRYQWAADEVLKCLLFAGESPLTDPVQGTSGFAEYFAALGPHDKHGRSLRQFDLQKRLFRYPCSYLIYSAAFDGLPEEVRSRVYEGLGRVLSGQDASLQFAHLSPGDRRAIREILLDTKPELAKIWKAESRDTN